MNSLDEIKSVVLKDKREIYLNDEGELSLSIVSDGKTVFEYSIDYPCAGYGDGSLHLSPDDIYLLFTYYSGQSEEAFMLFKISDGLEVVYGSDYLSGEAASYGFSNDIKLLIQGLPCICSEWWELANDAEEDINGEHFFDYGYINILDIEKKILSEHVIRIYVSNDWQPQEDEYNPMMSPKIVSDDTLKIQMPWGESIVNLPLKDKIIFKLS